MISETIPLVIEKHLLIELDKALKIAGYQTRQDFIRHAIIEKLDEIRLKRTIFEVSGPVKSKHQQEMSEEEMAEITEKAYEAHVRNTE